MLQQQKAKPSQFKVFDLEDISKQIPSSCYMDKLHLNEGANGKVNAGLLSALQSF